MTEKQITAPTTKDVVIAGCAAGLVHFAASGVFNGILLSEELHSWLANVGDSAHPLPLARAMLLWAAMSLCYGLIGAWYYAAMRSHRSGGLGTALLVGASMWLVTKATVALDLTALGMMPTRIIAGQSLAGLVAIGLAMLVAGWMIDRSAAHGDQSRRC